MSGVLQMLGSCSAQFDLHDGVHMAVRLEQSWLTSDTYCVAPKACRRDLQLLMVCLTAAAPAKSGRTGCAGPVCPLTAPAVNLLEPESHDVCCRWASTCQTIGMNTGYFASFTVFLALNDASFCNRQVTPAPGLAAGWAAAVYHSFYMTGRDASMSCQQGLSPQLAM